MYDDLLIEYKVYQTTHEMWQTLKEKYGELSATKLRELVLNFENYKIWYHKVQYFLKERETLNTLNHVM